MNTDSIAPHPLPAYVVLPTREIMHRYQQRYPMRLEHNWNELLNQIFDWIMDESLTAWPDHYLVKELFIDEEAFRYMSLDKLANELCAELKALLRSTTRAGLTPLDGGHFNYGFHQLRGRAIVIGHLADDPETSRRKS